MGTHGAPALRVMEREWGLTRRNGRPRELGRGDSAAGDGSSVRRRAGFFAGQRGNEKGRGKWGSRPGWAEEGGGGGPTCARQWRAPGGGGRRLGAVV
jgi:hypothetical protein